MIVEKCCFAQTSARRKFGEFTNTQSPIVGNATTVSSQVTFWIQATFSDVLNARKSCTVTSFVRGQIGLFIRRVVPSVDSCFDFDDMEILLTEVVSDSC